MPFRITKQVSNRDWGDVDKSSIWQRLKRGLEEKAEGVAEAIREMYAVVKAPINEDLTQADCWGPHHEIREDGSLVLNRAGLIAAAAALAGARAEPNLTSDQREEARRHLLRHYHELEMEPPASLVGEISAVQATVSGEIRVQDVPLAPWVDLAALKAGDPETLEVVVEIPAGKSKRGWNYTPAALQRIVGEVMKQGLPGFLGHQKPEDVDHEFPIPVTHWVGALWRDGKAYIRGVIDKSASDLKRWIKANVIRTVSIFGIPTLEQAGGETNVVDFKPLSIDWTPLGRAGMQTAVVAMGEMDVILAEGVIKEMGDWKAIASQLKEKLAKGEVTQDQVLGELGITIEKPSGESATVTQTTPPTSLPSDGMLSKIREALKVTGEMDIVKAATEAAKAAETLKKVKEVLGVTGEMDVVKVAEDAAKAVKEAKKAAFETMVNEVISQKVTGEMAQALVKKILNLPETASREQVVGEIDKILADPAVKEAIGRFYIDRPPVVGNTNQQHLTGLRVKRQAI